MPKLGKRPKWEKEDNINTIFYALLQKPQTFTELKKTSGLAKSTLSQHLKELQKTKLIEKALEEERIVYRTRYNEESIRARIRETRYDVLISVISNLDPELAKKLDAFIDLLAKTLIEAVKEVRKSKIKKVA